MDCDDHDDCTTDGCDDVARSCTHVISRDADGDTHTDLACGGDDCNDSDPNVFPGQLETCNRADDNCDGFTDEGLWEAGLAVQVTIGFDGYCGTGCAPSAVAVDSGTGDALVLWARQASPDELQARIVTPAGTFTSAARVVATGLGGYDRWGMDTNAVASSGGFVVGWMNGANEVWLRPLGIDGTLGTPVMVTAAGWGGLAPGLLRTSDAVVVTWMANPADVHLFARRYDPVTLSPLSPAVDAGPAGGSGHLSNPALRDGVVAIQWEGATGNVSLRGYLPSLVGTFPTVSLPSSTGWFPRNILPSSTG